MTAERSADRTAGSGFRREQPSRPTLDSGPRERSNRPSVRRPAPDRDPTSADVTPRAARSEHPSTIGWLAATVRPEAARLAAAVVFGVLAMSCSIGLMATSAWLISRAAQHPPVLYLTVAIVAVRAFGIGRGVLRYVERLAGHDAAFRVIAHTRIRTWLDLDRAAPAGLGKTRSGDLLSRITADVEALQDLLVRAILPILVSLITGLATVALLTALLPAAGAVLLTGLTVAAIGGPLASVLVAARAERRLAPTRAALTTNVHELLTGLADLTAYRATDRALDRIRAEDRQLTTALQHSARGAGIGTAVINAALALTVTGEILIGVTALRDGRLSGVLLAVLVLTPLAAFELITPLPVAARHLIRGLRATDRLHALTALPAPSVAWGTHPAVPGTLSAHHLTIRWPGAAEPALTDIDLDLTPGHRTALIGPSGSGKSTLAHALLGHLAPDQGQVTLNGSPLTDLDESSYRRQVLLCAQDDHLFDTTIRNNLLIGRPGASDADLYEVLDRVHLADWVRRQPAALDTTVGERAARLSGGERQRLALARTLLADPAVLILDEPTAHLDAATAMALMSDIAEATTGRTVLFITHRHTELDGFDEVLELRDGRLTSRRSPVEAVSAAAS